jgi:cytochrome c oxidase subunit III
MAEPGALAVQFDDLEEQHHAATLGMWVFLATEVMFFGGMFAGYAIYRLRHPEAFALGSREMHLLLGTVNTVVLITSSLTMALAVHAAATGRRRPLVACLLLTIVLGLVFLGIKYVEYSSHIRDGLLPGPSFRLAGPHPREVELFFSFYFAMTGTHALHMVIGIGVLAVLARAAARGRISAKHPAPVEVAGLYWHFVDNIWIFLYPLFYLIDIHR